jgi:uncharacterized protein (TIGR02996 family)
MDLLSQHEAFLRAIFDAPEDDTPRLVYADFLQENGEEERAEFIRVQCEIAIGSGDPSDSVQLSALKTREWELLDRLYPKRRYLKEHELGIDHERGFRPAARTLVVRTNLSNATADRWWYVQAEPEMFGARSMTVEAGVIHLGPEHVEALFALPVAQRITEWLLAGDIREVASGGEGEVLGLIDLVHSPAITTSGVETLAKHRGARRITHLDLRNNNLDNDAARALVNSPYLDGLKRLQLLEGNRLRGKVWQQVIERFGEDVVG